MWDQSAYKGGSPPSLDSDFQVNGDVIFTEDLLVTLRLVDQVRRRCSIRTSGTLPSIAMCHREPPPLHSHRPFLSTPPLPRAQAIQNSLILPRTGVLMVGQRRNCPFGHKLENLHFGDRCQLAADLSEILEGCTLMTPMALDFFIASQQTVVWKNLDDVVVGGIWHARASLCLSLSLSL